MKTCENCIWLSTGFADDERGSGWCYSNEDYRDWLDTCPFWQQSLRDTPLNDPPERQLIKAVAQLDTGIGGED
jgi:hypothetical protein